MISVECRATHCSSYDFTQALHEQLSAQRRRLRDEVRKGRCRRDSLSISRETHARSESHDVLRRPDHFARIDPLPLLYQSLHADTERLVSTQYRPLQGRRTPVLRQKRGMHVQPMSRVEPV